MNIAFYISGQSTRLKIFLKEATEAERAEVKLVFSNLMLEPNLKKVIQDFNINLYEKDFNDFEGTTREEKRISFSNELLRKLTENKIDYCFSFSKYLIAGEILSKYKNKIINFHPAILPMYPGVKAIDQALNDSRAPLLVGNTAHFIDAGMDTGPIIMQYVVPLQTFFDAGKDYHILMNPMNTMLQIILKLLRQNRISVDENNRVHIEGADYDKGQIFPFINF